MRLLRYTAVTAVVLAAGLIAPPSSAQAAVADAPSSTVEDYAYPGAAEVLAEHGLKVFTGDGNIRFAEVRSFDDGGCATGQIQIESWVEGPPFGLYYCFTVHAPRGFLTLEMTGVGGARGASQPFDAITTWRGQREVHHVELPTDTVAIQPGEGPDLPESVLLELRLTGTASATPTPSAHPYVAQLQVGGTGQGARACSGVLVSEQMLLTAKTCFADSGVAAGPPPKPTRVVVGRGDVTAGGGYDTTVTEVIPHASRDVALARLASPALGIAPVLLGRTPAQATEELLAAGYGRTATNWVGRQLKTGTLRASEVGADAVTAVRTGAAPSTCKGDLGGPLLRSTGGLFEVVAIHGPSWQAGCFGVSQTNDAATETRVDDLADWIAQVSGRPLGLWQMGESGGSTLADTGGGLRRAFTVSGATPGQPGRVVGDRAVTFDGVDDTASVTGGAVIDTSRDYTFAVWARPDSIGQTRPLLSANGTRDSAFAVRLNTQGRWEFSMTSALIFPPTSRTVVGHSVNRAGVWAHVAGSYDATAKVMRLYVNGTLEATLSGISGAFTAAGLQLGQQLSMGTFGSGRWQGAVSELKLWNMLVSPEGIGSATPVGLWDLNGGGTDASGRGSHLTTHTATYAPGVSGQAAKIDNLSDAFNRSAVLHSGQSYTVSAWTRVDARSGFGDKNIIAQYDNLATPGQPGVRKPLFELQYNSGDRFGMRAGAAAVNAGQPPTLAVWQHVTAVHDATRQQLRLYVGGTLQGTAPYTSDPQVTSSLVFVGGETGIMTEPTPYAIDDVRAYQGVLSEAEIAKLTLYPAAQTATTTLTGAIELATDPSGARGWKLPAGTLIEAGQVVQLGRGRLVMQTDGNLVLYDEFGRARWSTNTAGTGKYARMQPDGNFVLYGPGDTAVWSSGTAQAPVPPTPGTS